MQALLVKKAWESCLTIEPLSHYNWEMKFTGYQHIPASKPNSIKKSGGIKTKTPDRQCLSGVSNFYNSID